MDSMEILTFPTLSWAAGVIGLGLLATPVFALEVDKINKLQRDIKVQQKQLEMQQKQLNEQEQLMRMLQNQMPAVGEDTNTTTQKPLKKNRCFKWRGKD